MSCIHSPAQDFTKCPKCGEVVLPPESRILNYFELFSIKPCYSIDLNLVQKRFYELSRLLHPDRFQKKSSKILSLSTHWSAVLNQAFKTLSDNEDRAFYLFELAHFKSEGKGALPPELAEDYFSLQEALEEDAAQAKNAVKEFYGQLKEKIQETDESIDQTFKDWEMARSPLDERANAFFSSVAKSLQQKSYLRSMSQDLEKKWPL